MTSNPNNPETISSNIQKAIEEQRFDEALNAFTDLHPADQAEVFNDLDDDQQDLILRNLDVPTTADLFDELEKLGLEYVPTQTNFFLIKVPSGGKKTYELMLKEGVIVRSMHSYGLDEYIRINVGLPEENERFINTLQKVLK